MAILTGSAFARAARASGTIRRLSLVAVLAFTISSTWISGGSFPAAAGSSTDLALTSFDDLVVDGTGNHVFVSGDDEVVVLDLDGTILQRITGMSGAAGMVLHDGILFVALRTANVIARIDATTLLRLPDLDLAGLTEPHSPGVAGGRLWFGYGRCGGEAGMASIGLPAGDIKSYGRNASEVPNYCPFFVTTPAQPDRLIAIEAGLSGAPAYLFDVSTDPPTLLRQDWVCGYISDALIVPDGTLLLVPCGTEVRVYRTNDLMPTGFMYQNPGPQGFSSVAYTSRGGGYIAAGRYGPYDPDIYVFPAGNPTPYEPFKFPTGEEVHDGGVAFDPDGSRLYVATGDTTHVTLQILEDPTLPTAPLSVDLSKPVVSYGKKVTVTAHVVGGGGSPTPVSIYQIPYKGSKSLLKKGTLDASGNLVVSFEPKKQTKLVAEWPGDDDFRSTAVSEVVEVKAVASGRLLGHYDRRGKYRLFHATEAPLYIFKVRPNHAGRKIELLLQLHRKKWNTVDRAEFRLNAKSKKKIVILGLIEGDDIRVRGRFIEDREHLTDWSTWSYIRITD